MNEVFINNFSTVHGTMLLLNGRLLEYYVFQDLWQNSGMHEQCVPPAHGTPHGDKPTYHQGAIVFHMHTYIFPYGIANNYKEL